MDDLVIPQEQQEAIDIVLATVTEVTANGLKIQVDGNDAAGQKEYKCNTASMFKAGDRVKITENSGTYIVDFAIGEPMSAYPIPTGGASGQVLTKDGQADYAIKWADAPHGIPSGGSAGQVLVKASATAYDVAWRSSGIPTGGTAGQVLAKVSATNYDVAWRSSAVPTGGTAGQVLAKVTAANYETKWVDVVATNGLPVGGTTGQVLTKSSATNYAVTWGNIAVSSLKNGNYTLSLSNAGVLSGSSTSNQITLGTSTVPFKNAFITGELHLGTLSTDKIGFFGHTVSSRQTVSSTATVATLITALKAYGLIA